MTEPLLIDRTDAVVTLTLNRPESLNALNVALKEALRDTVAALATDPSCRAVVLAGAYVLLVAANFAYFYPIYIGQLITYDGWQARMWLSTWA